MLAGLLKKIAKAGGKANIKSEASAARNAVRKNPKMTGKKEDDAITKINNAEKAAKNKITNRGRAAAQEGARKRYVNPDPAMEEVNSLFTTASIMVKIISHKLTFL